MGIVDKFKSNYRKAKAEIKGEAKSVARLIKAAIDIPGMLQPRVPRHKRYHPRTPFTLLRNRHRVPAAVGIAGAYVRMLDKKPMQFFTDGSLRHVLPGMKPGKGLRKALKRQRQRQRAESVRRASMVQQTA